MSVCRSCGAPIVWCVTTAGKRMPVDSDPVENGNLVIVPQEGPWREPLVRVLAKDEVVTEDRFVSHFVSCPNAKAHRK